jgi:hypothetical protein
MFKDSDDLVNAEDSECPTTTLSSNHDPVSSTTEKMEQYIGEQTL